MAPPNAVIEFLGRVGFEASKLRPLAPMYLHLMASAIFPIYTGAHASLSRPSSAAPPEKKKQGDRSGEDGVVDEVVLEKMEGLSPSDALTFPLMAGLVLTSLYLLLKWLKTPEILNQILGYYFSQVGLVFGAKFTKDALSLARSFLWPTQYASKGMVWKANHQKRCYEAMDTAGLNTPMTPQTSPLPGFLRHIPLGSSVSARMWDLRKILYTNATLKLHLHNLVTLLSTISILDLVSFTSSVVLVSYFTFQSKPWFLTNFLGFAFSYGSLQYMSPTTFWTGTLLLSGLFLYDIYFVFFTPMMVTVATQLNVPIKLLFPRPTGCILPPLGTDTASALWEEYQKCKAGKKPMAMLGLGDIVIPGMMVALALRFDLYLFYKRLARQEKRVNTEDENHHPSTVTKTHEQNPKYLAVTGGWGERFWSRGGGVEVAELKAKNFPKTYFHSSLVGYLVGMAATLLAMQVTERGQPALLYLVPTVLTALWGTAVVKGELKEMWTFTEEAVEEQETQKKGGKTEEMKLIQGEKGSKTAIEKVEADNNGEDAPTTKTPEDEDDEATGEQKAKKEHDRSCRELISFSITLPPLPHVEDNPTATSTIALKGSEKFQSHSPSSALSSPSPEPALATKGVLNAEGQPPPAKRQRRGEANSDEDHQ